MTSIFLFSFNVDTYFLYIFNKININIFSNFLNRYLSSVIFYKMVILSLILFKN